MKIIFLKKEYEMLKEACVREQVDISNLEFKPIILDNQESFELNSTNEELIDDMRNACGVLVGATFTENDEPTEDTHVLESLIDKLFVGKKMGT